jgi:anti-anti-sigma factor
MSAIEITTEEREGIAAVRLVGELDISNAWRVEKELRRIEEGRPESVVLDLRGLEFLDSTGLRLVVSADMRAREGGWRMSVVRGPEAVDRVFRITLVEKRLQFVDDPFAAAGETL